MNYTLDIIWSQDPSGVDKLLFKRKLNVDTSHFPDWFSVNDLPDIFRGFLDLETGSAFILGTDFFVRLHIGEYIKDDPDYPRNMLKDVAEFKKVMEQELDMETILVLLDAPHSESCEPEEKNLLNRIVSK